MARIPFLLALFALALPAADALYESAHHKLDLIESGQAKPGSIVAFPPEEIDAWVRARVPELAPEGIRNPRVELGAGGGAGYALVDFLKLRSGLGEATNRLMARLIEGERPLKAAVRIESGGGRATVFLTRVELSNVVANGALLDFLIKTFFLPLYPDAKINEPFDLGYNIDRVDIRPMGVRVTIKK